MLKKIFLAAALMLALMLGAVPTEAANVDGYEYTSAQYNYSIICPKQPSVVPVSLLYEDDSKRGEVLIFESDGYFIKSGWVIIFDAFDSTLIPNFNKDSKKLIDQYIEAKKKNGYDSLELFELTKGNKGVIGITAKEIEIDEDGDGTIDGVAVADRQEAVVFFRSELGRCISIQMMNNEINETTLGNFRAALSTYKDINPNDKKTGDKKSKDKKSKDKKSKKDDKK